jgi:enamine deaminase RidA (YjgF/YER057c/UK114 family)
MHMRLATTSEQRTLINPPGTEEFYDTWQFSQAARVGDTVWLAGQLGIGPDGRPGATIEEQTRFAFENLARVLEAAGGSLTDIVDLTTYHIAMSDLPKVAAVKAEFIKANFPPWTAVGVTQLALPEMLIEVKATAVIGSSA